MRSLVSLNNRIAIRDTSADGRLISIIRFHAVALPGAAAAASESAEFELEKVPHSFKDWMATTVDQG
jgi:hypothetical protein